MANITTRISLRNDILSNWNSSNVKLNKGEVAFAQLSGDLSDKYEMRIGVGNKTWSELSNGGIMISSKDIDGLDSILCSFLSADEYISGTLSTRIDNNDKDIDYLSTNLSISISESATTLSSILKSYVVKQGTREVGIIDIPKDFLVKSATIKTVTTPNQPYEGAQVGDKYIDLEINAKTGETEDSHLYIPIKDMVDAYSGATTDTISVQIGDNNDISAIILDNSILAKHLSNDSVTSEKIVNGAITTDKINDNSVTNEKIAANAVTLNNLSNDVTDHISNSIQTCYSNINNTISSMSVDWSSNANQTIISVAQRNGIVDLSAIDISISTSQINDLANVINQYVPLSIASNSATSTNKLQTATETSSIAQTYATSAINSLDVDAITIGTNKIISSISEVDGIISIATADISISQDQVANLGTDLTQLRNTKLDISSFNQLSNDIGLSAASTENPVVTQNDIADIAGVMHFVGPITINEGETVAQAVARTYPDHISKGGDIVVEIATSKEYLYTGSEWVELGDETLYVTKGEYENGISTVNNAINSKIIIDGISATSLSIVHISQDEYYQKVFTSSIISNELYIVSGEYINAYGAQIRNVAEPELSNDAATRNYVDTAVARVATNSISDIVLNDVHFTVESNVASLSIDAIECGNALI